MEKDRLSRYTDTKLKHIKITEIEELPKEYLEGEKEEIKSPQKGEYYDKYRRITRNRQWIEGIT